ncbi:hypothetical protein G7046_g3559 [Stylonectria norvegica]|nr:hypothetical protein G7046_g3559 [Stylonectria norvegica]
MSAPNSNDARNAANNMEQWRQQAMTERNQYYARVNEQIQRNFQEYSPPLYASVVGYRRDWNLAVAGSRIAGFCATLRREMTDEEAKAVAEHTLKGIHRDAAWKYATFGIAGVMTYRGRKTWQFPFYKPKFAGKLNPNEANSLFSNKKVRGFYPQLMWHTMRFTAYAIVTMLMTEPVARIINTMNTEQAMMQDPRLKRLADDATDRVQEVMEKGPYTRKIRKAVEVGAYGDHEEDGNAAAFAQEQPEQSPEPEQQGGYDDAPLNRSRNVPSAWSRMPGRPPAQAQPQTSDDDWSVLDEADDASPTAPAYRGQPAKPAASGGSAWERLRSQNAPQSQPTSQAEWGSDNAGTSPEYRGARESYAYTRADEEKALAKEQAQAEFDKLLDRERQGTDQDRSWGRR